MPRSAPRPSPRAAATSDAIALLAFVLVGVARHRGVVLPGLLRTGIPLLAAWYPIALLVGAYRRTGWVTMLLTWVIATPLGLLGRSAIQGGPWGDQLLDFGSIALGFTLLFLVGGRLLLLGAALLQRSRTRADPEGSRG